MALAGGICAPLGTCCSLNSSRAVDKGISCISVSPFSTISECHVWSVQWSCRSLSIKSSSNVTVDFIDGDIKKPAQSQVHAKSDIDIKDQYLRTKNPKSSDLFIFSY